MSYFLKLQEHVINLGEFQKFLQVSDGQETEW